MRLKYSLSAYDSLKAPAILTIGCSSDINETKFGPATRNEYLIHYVVSGKGYFNGSPVGEGEGFLITPHSYEHYYADESDPWAYLWIISKDSEMDFFSSATRLIRKREYFIFGISTW